MGLPQLTSHCRTPTPLSALLWYDSAEEQSWRTHMRSALLANAIDISFWAVRRDAQHTMPQLLRRLIHARKLDGGKCLR